MSVFPVRSVFAPALRQHFDVIDFGRRRFRLRPGSSRLVLESAGRSFLAGSNALISASHDEWVNAFDAIDPELWGFAYEGAGMACTVLDPLTLSSGRRLRACKARCASAVVPAHTEKAAAVLAGVTASEAAAWTEQALTLLGPAPCTAEHYQQWRTEIRALWAQQQGGHVDVA